MRCSKFFLMLVMVFFVSVQCRAQDTEYVYKDSSAMAPDTVPDAVVSESHKNESIQNYVAEDTLLKKNQLIMVNDSAESLKNTADLLYAKNLDSVLKELQKKQSARVVAPERTGPSWLERFFFSSVTKIFFWSLGILFIGFILYKLFFTEGIFQRQSKSSSIEVVKEEAENLSATTDYARLIAQSVINKNYRAATRYHYLQTLQKLAAKDSIQLAADKTNYQYLSDLSGKPYKEDFASLLHMYEYAWYGGFDISDAMFARIQHTFTTFNNQL